MRFQKLNPIILCKCGCGQTRQKFDRKGRERLYIYTHYSIKYNVGNTYNVGRPNTPEQKLKISIANTGKNNGMWKGDNCGYEALHKWVRKHLPAPQLCQICNLKSPYDLANITDMYNREFKNWKYLCRSCHMISDNRIQNLKQFQFKKGSNGR